MRRRPLYLELESRLKENGNLEDIFEKLEDIRVSPLEGTQNLFEKRVWV
jgi:hypothetical protein